MVPVRISSVVLGLVAMLAGPLAAWAFEGIIHMQMSGAGSPGGMQMRWYLKGNKARMEMARPEGPAWVSIVDYERRVMLMPLPGQQSYMELDMDEAQDGPGNGLEQYELERTGKSDRVAGHACEIWLVKDRQGGALRNEICVAKGFDNAAKLWGIEADRSRKRPAWQKEFQKQGAFALRMIGRRGDGTEEMRMEATSIENKVLDGSLFAMPAGYTKMDMPRLPFGTDGKDMHRKGRDHMPNFMREMRKRVEEETGAAENEDRSREAEELMKRLGDMMKKHQQGGE